MDSPICLRCQDGNRWAGFPVIDVGGEHVGWLCADCYLYWVGGYTTSPPVLADEGQGARRVVNVARPNAIYARGDY